MTDTSPTTIITKQEDPPPKEEEENKTPVESKAVETKEPPSTPMAAAATATPKTPTAAAVTEAPKPVVTPSTTTTATATPTALVPKKKVYRDEVLGSSVLIEFLIDVNRRAWFRGQILKFQMCWTQKGGPPKLEHFVRFDDGDERWFALTVEEEMGRLQWTTTTGASTKSDATPPARKNSKPTVQLKRPGTTSIAAPERKRLKMEDTEESAGEESGREEEDEDDDDEDLEDDDEDENLPYEERIANLAKEPEHEWMDDMRHWLETVPHGRVKKTVSPSNASKVMSQVSKLVAGKGITYKNWPSSVCFYGGVRINLSYDFDKLLKVAKDFEVMYGEDKGHGWLLRHPIQKMGLYREHRLKYS